MKLQDMTYPEVWLWLFKLFIIYYRSMEYEKNPSKHTEYLHNIDIASITRVCQYNVTASGFFIRKTNIIQMKTPYW